MPFDRTHDLLLVFRCITVRIYLLPFLGYRLFPTKIKKVTWFWTHSCGGNLSCMR